MITDEFLIWVEAQEGRWEFDRPGPVALPGDTNAHGIITGNIYVGLRQRLRASPCRPMTASAGGVATIEQCVRFPDIVVTCAPVLGTDRLIPSPIVLFEVVGPSTHGLDHVTKVREYQAIPSLRCYVLVEQSWPALRVLRRDGEGSWEQPQQPITDGELNLPWIRVSLSLAEIYENLTFPL